MKIFLNYWFRNKERFILLMIGILVISSGLSYLVGSSENSSGTVVNLLKENWKAQYHILVRPPGSKSVSEKNNLLSPNYLSGIKGGISLEQYRTIKDMNSISVAAPIAMIGYIDTGIQYAPFSHIKEKPNSVYRIVMTKSNKVGKQLNNQQQIFYITDNNQIVNNDLVKNYSLLPYKNLNSLYVSSDQFLLLAAIDPLEEAKLTGLNKAVIGQGNSRYFTKKDQAITTKGTNSFASTNTQLPILVSNHQYNNTNYNYKLQLVNDNGMSQNTFKKKLINQGINFLNKLPGKTLAEKNITEKKYYQEMLQGMVPKLSKSKKNSAFNCGGGCLQGGSILALYPSPLKIHSIGSPYPTRWRNAFGLQAQTSTIPKALKFVGLNSNGYRKYVDATKNAFHYLNMNFVGIYNPQKLHISKDALTKLPMQTYRPPQAKLVLDSQKRPINPPLNVYPTDSPNGYLQEPPTMLTTLDAAKQLLGEKPISAIRIKVKGVNHLNNTSEKKLKTIAKKIEEKTGLIADVTLGSSPQPTLLEIPKSGGIHSPGWLEMPWIKLGSTFTLFHETKVGFSSTLGIVMLVAIAYVLATNLVSFLARKEQWAILLAIGWRPTSFLKIILLESLLFGGIAALCSFIIELSFFGLHQNVTFMKIIIVAILSLLIFFLGSIGPMLLVLKLSPYDALKSGEISKQARRVISIPGVIGLAINHMAGKINRYMLSIIAMVFPTVLIAFFMFVTLRLKGIFYTTWLGQYAALQVGAEQYIAVIISLLIAVFTTAEIMWQNITERHAEIALYKSIGWKDRTIRQLIFSEGIFIGFIAGIVSIVGALCAIWFLYHQFPFNSLLIIILVGFIPMIVGLIGSLIPAEIAARINPFDGIKRE